MDLLASYRDPLFWRFPIATVALSAFAFLLFAAPLTFLAARDPPALRRYRLQARPPRPQRLLRPALWSWLRNNLLLLSLVVLAWPALRRSGIHDGPRPPLWLSAVQVLLFVYLDDLLYYFMHRLMHVPWLFKRVHGLHHRIRAPWAITGHYMHPIEYLLTGALALVGPLLLSVHVVTLWLWVACRQWEAAEGHSGYDLPGSPSHLIPFGDGAVHHDFHHARVRGNYGGFLPVVDLLLGTCAAGYRADRRRRGKRW